MPDRVTKVHTPHFVGGKTTSPARTEPHVHTTRVTKHAVLTKAAPPMRQSSGRKK